MAEGGLQDLLTDGHAFDEAQLAAVSFYTRHSGPTLGHTLESMSEAAHHHAGTARGTSLLPADMSRDQLASAPVMTSLDSLLIDDLTDDEDDAFAAALDA